MGTALRKTVELTDTAELRDGMSAAAQVAAVKAAAAEWTPGFGQSWWRFRFTVPASIAFSALLLAGFSILLKPRLFAPEHREAVEVKLIEITPKPAGLQGAAKPRAIPQPIAPVPRITAKRHPRIHPPTVPAMGPPVVSPHGMALPSGLPPARSAAPAAGAGEGGGAGGIGSDTIGARAIYAPTPEIPDDLRENLLETEAIARFTVGSDGSAEVTLVKPTSNPRLNQVLLHTLRQWKFYPAIKNGIAIDSVFEIRIPITVE